MSKKWIDECREWAKKWTSDERNRSWNLIQSKRELARKVQHAVREGLFLPAGIGVNMMLVENWFAMMASIQLLSNDASGWVALQTAYLYENWPTRIELGYQQLGRSKARLRAWDTTLGFAHAIAIRDEHFTEILGPLLIDAVEGKNDRFQSWNERTFEPFIVELYARLTHRVVKPCDNIAYSFGPYQQVFDHWDDVEELSHVLHELCDIHIEETKDDDELGHIPAFGRAPYATFPVEMLAVRRVREDLGLPTPDIDHPLMQTMMAHPPAVMPEVHDEVLDQIIAKARQEGIAGDPW